MDLIINIDETSITPISPKAKVVVPTNSYVIPTKLIQQRRKNSTLTLAVSMSGKSYSSQLIWNSTKIPAELESLRQYNIYIQSNGCGWQTKETFMDYMCNSLIPELVNQRSVLHLSCPIIIISDGHVSRKNPDLLKKLVKD